MVFCFSEPVCCLPVAVVVDATAVQLRKKREDEEHIELSVDR